MSNIAQLYESGQMSGWPGQDVAEEEFNLIKDQFPFVSFTLPYEDTPGRYMLWEIRRKLLGKDTPRLAQLIGDCTSFAAKNCMETLQAVEIVINRDLEEWKEIFSCYVYGCGRKYILGGRISGDGSTGSATAGALIKYGCLSVDVPNCPSYSAKISREWGRNGPPQEFIEIGKKHLVKSATKITTWEQLVTALKNGFVCNVCSNQGFTMKAVDGEFGWNEARGSWAHSMAILGIVNGVNGVEDHVCIENSWGSQAHSPLKDLVHRNVDWPLCTLRVRRKVVEKMLAQNDTYAYSSFDGFPKRQIDWDEFKLF